MKARKRSQLGVTILEILLVLAIGASLIMMGISQYRTLNTDKNVQQLKANVNTILQGMAGFYFVNCNGYYRPGTDRIMPGRLNPYQVTSFPVVVNITNDLVNRGFISTTLSTVVPFNALVNSSGGGAQPRGYIAQFNRYDQDRRVCTAASGAGVTNGPNDPNCTSTQVTGRSVILRAQVSVRLNENIPPSQYTNYKNLTTADCLSRSGSGGSVNPCSQNTSGDYLVWERLPSMIATENQGTSSYWGNSVNMREFYQLFNQYPDLSTNMPGATQGRLPPSPSQVHYYLCGS